MLTGFKTEKRTRNDYKKILSNFEAALHVTGKSWLKHLSLFSTREQCLRGKKILVERCVGKFKRPRMQMSQVVSQFLLSFSYMYGHDALCMHTHSSCMTLLLFCAFTFLRLWDTL